ncbi:MAG: ferredoxin--NADP reductase [Myxococcales bacterium]|nr:ferredoxin--NADP reductase [Myxococcales bacterium]
MAFVETKVTARRDWAEGLFSLQLAAEAPAFEPGQWLRLAKTLAGERVARSYSIASAPGAPLELFIVTTPGGALTPALAALREGDPVEIDPTPYGFFTLRYLPEARDLWLLATGTGLAPFLSMLRSGELWPRFERVVLAHGVRRAVDLAYREELYAVAETHPLRYLPFTTRETVAGLGHGRLDAALESGDLEEHAGMALDPARSHLMLCGNPGMLASVTEAAQRRGLRKHRTRKPGHITSEAYWEAPRVP